MGDKWLVVTGGGNGIGAAIARSGAAAGWKVAVWDLDLEAATAVADSLGNGSIAARVDVAAEAAVDAAMAAVPTAPSAVVNNAGAVRFGPLIDLAAEDFLLALKVNLAGAFLVARSAARRLRDIGTGGAFVNIASINGVSAAPFAGGYSASKAGLIMLTEQMALEFAQYGIRVNAVAPGLIDGGMSETIYADPEVRRLRTARVPLNRLGSLEDIASAVMYVISDGASYLTGQTIVVDGGITKTALNGLARPASVDKVGI